MNKKKILSGIILFLIILTLGKGAFAKYESVLKNLVQPEYSEEYKKWIELPEEEKEKTIQPIMYDIPKTSFQTKNPLRLARFFGVATERRYNLADVLSANNLRIKDQKQTNSCWAFATLSSLETNLALKNHYNGDDETVYDFSERHLVYSSVRDFLNNAINEKGFNVTPMFGGNYIFAEAYLTNGSGAINESEMPFENNEDKINISQIQNKTVTSKVEDTVIFPSCYPDDENIGEIKLKIKEHIKTNGAVFAAIHVKEDNEAGNSYYNNETGAHCYKGELGPNHAISIVGWDDDYDVTNFCEEYRPTTPGAWIVRNSYGAEIKYTIEEFKALIKEEYGMDVTDEQIIEFVNQTEGYSFDEENNIVYKYGDNGFIYVSYEDVNIYTSLSGIVNASDEVDYENIYQYNNSSHYSLAATIKKIYMANVFEKNTDGDEYLTEVSLNLLTPSTCKVYVNVNGDSKAKEDLQLVQLEEGNSKTIRDAGYHTLKFAHPLKINSDKFVVVIEIESNGKILIEENDNIVEKDGMMIPLEANMIFETDKKGNIYYITFDDYVETENNKCFFTDSQLYESNQWVDLGEISSDPNTDYLDSDSTIKAFTVSEIEDELKDITIEKVNNKTYIVGDNFDRNSIKVWANYYSGNREEVTDYTVSKENNLQKTDTSLTITYEGKTATLNISVIENSVKAISIKTPPKTEYYEGEHFDPSGMIITVTYERGEADIEEGFTFDKTGKLKKTDSVVTISYGGKTTTLNISVLENSVKSISIKTPPKTQYYEGEYFDPSGMVITVTYERGEADIEEGFTFDKTGKLKMTDSVVIISYGGKTATLNITVLKNSVTGIAIKTPPTKTEYYEGELFDPTGMVITVTREIGNPEDIEDGFTYDKTDELTINDDIVTITYEGKTATQDITVEINDVKSIRIKTPPTNTRYIVGDYFNPDGMVIEATKKDGTTYDVYSNQEDTFTYDKTGKLTVNDRTVTVTYRGFTATQAITVDENSITGISIKTPPTKTTYTEGEYFDPEGMVITVKYKRGEEDIEEGFTFDKTGKLTANDSIVTITYEGKTATQRITVNKEIVYPENSNFDNMKNEIKSIATYNYTDKNKKDFTLIEIELRGIEVSTLNDDLEYYYYLSSSIAENNIDNWIKIENATIKDGKLVFTIDTKDLDNYDEVLKSETLYLYIKEVATLGEEEHSEVPTPISLQISQLRASSIFKMYLDDVEQTPGGDDPTVAPEYPYTGKTILTLTIACVAAFGLVQFIKYRRLKDIK